MAKYTIELRTVCEAYAGVASPDMWTPPKVVQEKAAPYVFDFDWPIFDESYRTHLEMMVLRRYYTRELCCGEVGRWKMFLEQRLNEIMPKYNPMYKAMLTDFNPFWDTDYTDSHRKNVQEDGTQSTRDVTDRDTTNSATGETSIDSTVTSTGTVSTDGTVTDNGRTTDNSTRTDNLHSWDRYSDTPQGALTNVQNDTYLTNARGIDNTGTQGTETQGTSQNTQTTDNTVTNNLTDATDGTTTSTTSASGTEDVVKTGEKTTGLTTVEEYLQTVRGKRSSSSYAKLLAEYRELFTSVDQMVLDELQDLFMCVW